MDRPVLPSTLQAVTVYASGAVCTRRARLPRLDQPSPRLVRVSGLPLSAIATSLRARVAESPPGLRVTDARIFYEAQPVLEADLPAAHRALEQADAVLAELAHRRAFLDEEVKSIQALEPIYPKSKAGQPPRIAAVGTILDLADLVEGELARLQAEQLRLAAELRDAQEALELARQRVDEGSSAERGQRTRVEALAELTLSGASGDEAELVLEYLVPGARWAPAYQLVLDGALSTGTLVLRASVAQRTGEDWKGVALSLSTADLLQRNEVPELRSLRIGRAQPTPPRSGWRDPPAGLTELFSGYDGALIHRASLRPPHPASPPAQPVGFSEVFDLGEDADSEKLVESWSEAAAAPVCEPPPPASSRAPPAPMMAAAPAGAPALMAKRSRAASVKKEMARNTKPSAMRADAMSPEEEPGPAGAGAGAQDAIAPEESLLDYANLVLEGPEVGARRGKLSPASANPQTEVSSLVRVRERVAAAQAAACAVVSAPLPSHVEPIRRSAGSYDYRYDAGHPVDLLSDGDWHTVTLFEADVRVTPEYVAVPAVDPHAYRTVKIENRSPHALLAGPADVLAGGAYLLTVPFRTLPPFGSGRVGMGVVEGIRIARNTRFEEGSGGLLAGSTVLTHAVELEVANRLTHPASIELRERIPVTSEKEIQVEERASDPRWEPFAQEEEGKPSPGGRRWRVVLAAGESKKFSAAYTVRIPANKMLSGGNRRG